MTLSFFEKEKLFSLTNNIEKKVDSILESCQMFDAMFGETVTAKVAVDMMWEEVFAPFYRYGYGDCTLDDALKTPEAKIAVEELAKIFKKISLAIIEEANKK